ncbi:hypothetical protein ACN08N_28135 (plasmid) [Photobacterium leiognathi subsp. mandapamensis]
MTQEEKHQHWINIISNQQKADFLFHNFASSMTLIMPLFIIG